MNRLPVLLISTTLFLATFLSMARASQAIPKIVDFSSDTMNHYPMELPYTKLRPAVIPGQPYRTGSGFESYRSEIGLRVDIDKKVGNDEFGKELCMSIKIFQAKKVHEVLKQIRADRSGDGNYYFSPGSDEFGYHGTCQLTDWTDTSFQIRLIYFDSIVFWINGDRGGHPLRNYGLRGVIECLLNSEHQWRCLCRDDNSFSRNEENDVKRGPYDSSWRAGILETIEKKISAYY
ncbi:MAG: hypothetical protein HQK53_07290 [Oligoflexia bacterium]|nr:hypothetical protein [Oligoflexia bacterium]